MTFIRNTTVSYPIEFIFAPDDIIRDYMESIGVKSVGSGTGFGFRDLEFEGGNWSSDDILNALEAIPKLQDITIDVSIQEYDDEK